MNEVNALLAENEDFKFVECVFAPYTGQRTYTYKTTLDLAEDDFVVVDTPSNGLAIVQVRSIKDFYDVNHDVRYQYKWVVQKVDTAAYEEAVKLEETLMAQVNKVKRKQKRKEIQETMLGQMDETDREEVRKLVRL